MASEAAFTIVPSVQTRTPTSLCLQKPSAAAVCRSAPSRCHTGHEPGQLSLRHVAGSGGALVPVPKVFSVDAGNGVNVGASSSAFYKGNRASFFGQSLVFEVPSASFSHEEALQIECNLVNRFVRVVKATVGSLISKAEDPEKMLEQAVTEMQEDLMKLRKATAEVIAGEKQTQRQLDQALKNSEAWFARAQMALKSGNEELAREALKRRKTYEETASTLKMQLEQQQQVATKLTGNMATLEGKLSEAKTKKDMYIARARSAKTQQRVNEMLGTVSTSGALEAFERMEQKVLTMEAQAEAVEDLAQDSLSKQFAALESSSTADDDLDQLKRQMGLLTSNSSAGTSEKKRQQLLDSDPSIELELEKMRKRQSQDL